MAGREAGWCCKKWRRTARRRPNAANQGQDTGMNGDGDKTKAHTSLSYRLRATEPFSFCSSFSVVFFFDRGQRSVNNEKG